MKPIGKQRLGIPLLPWSLVGGVAVTAVLLSWYETQAHWLGPFIFAACIPAWGWAIEPHTTGLNLRAFRRTLWLRSALSPSLVVALIVMVMVVVIGGNQLWTVIVGGPRYFIILFVFMLTYGAYIREKFGLCGLLCGLACLVNISGWVIFASLILVHVFRRRWQGRMDLLSMTAPVVIAIAPLIWQNGIHLTANLPGLYLNGEILVRARWQSFISPYLGDFFAHAFTLAMLLAASFVYGVYRRRQRALVGLAWAWTLIQLYQSSLWPASIQRADFLIGDCLLLTWLTLMLGDSNIGLRNIARGLVTFIVVINLLGRLSSYL